MSSAITFNALIQLHTKQNYTTSFSFCLCLFSRVRSQAKPSSGIRGKTTILSEKKRKVSTLRALGVLALFAVILHFCPSTVFRKLLPGPDHRSASHITLPGPMPLDRNPRSGPIPLRQLDPAGRPRGPHRGRADRPRHSAFRTQQSSVTLFPATCPAALRPAATHTHHHTRAQTHAPSRAQPSRAYGREEGKEVEETARAEKVDPCVAGAAKRWDGFLQGPDREPGYRRPTESPPS